VEGAVGHGVGGGPGELLGPEGFQDVLEDFPLE
jgi:hypothetical protein